MPICVWFNYFGLLSSTFYLAEGEEMENRRLYGKHLNWKTISTFQINSTERNPTIDVDKLFCNAFAFIEWFVYLLKARQLPKLLAHSNDQFFIVHAFICQSEKTVDSFWNRTNMVILKNRLNWDSDDIISNAINRRDYLFASFFRFASQRLIKSSYHGLVFTHLRILSYF